MPISVACPACGAKLKAPDNAAGRTVKCLKCGEAIAVPSAAAVSPVPVQSPAQPVPTSNSKPCPFCGEQILAAAKKCKHCGEVIDPTMRAAEEPERPSRRSRRDEEDEEDRPR